MRSEERPPSVVAFGPTLLLEVGHPGRYGGPGGLGGHEAHGSLVRRSIGTVGGVYTRVPAPLSLCVSPSPPISFVCVCAPVTSHRPSLSTLPIDLPCSGVWAQDLL